MDHNLGNSGTFNGGQPNASSVIGGFGGFGDETTFNQPNFSSPLFTDDKGDFNYSLDGPDSSDLAEHKRRRIARACDLCRRRKIKCDGRMPCSHCKNYNSECVYHFEQKARKPAKTAKYIEGLENRLGRMEHLLRLSGLLGEKEEGKTDLGVLEQRLAQRAASDQNSPTSHSDRLSSTSRSQTTGRESPHKLSTHSPVLSSPVVPEKKDIDPGTPEVDDLSEMMDSLVTNNFGETRYIGSSSGFSIISPRGIQWVSEKLGNQSFKEIVTKISEDDNKWAKWKPEVFTDIFERKVFTPLPPQEECMSLVYNYFETFNNLFPLFHEPTFKHLVEKQYSSEPYEGTGWWASLNVALAISCKTHGMRERVAAYEERGWSYFKNALAVIPELTLRNTDLLSCQALLGMTMFLQGTPNSQPSFVLVGSAIRLAHSIGLHKRGSAYGFNEQETEQRKRVFWIAYMMDKDISLRSGRPPTQDDDDWNVELPSEDPEDGVGDVELPNGAGKVNLFRKLAEFGIINGKVYSRLYSVKASKQTDGELLGTISDLDQELEKWKDSLPVEFRPETGLEQSQLSQTFMLHLTLLHFGYYNLLTTIHRRSIHHGYWTGRLAQYAIEGRNIAPLNHRVFSSAALCVTAARMSITLLNNVPPNDHTLLWLIVYYPFSALMTLFANVLQNPQDAHARSDLKLMWVVADRLGMAAQEDATGSMMRISGLAREFTKLVAAVVDKTEREMSTRQKRKQEREREKLVKSTERHPKGVVSSSRLKSVSGGMAQDYLDVQTAPSARSGSSDSGFSPSLGMNQASQPGQGTSFQPTSFSDPSSDTFFNGTSKDAFPSTLGAAAANDMGNTPDFSQSDFQYPYGAPISNAFATDDGFNLNNAGNGQMFGSNDFQQAFIPQDLWTAPMSFDWDWGNLGNMQP